MLHADHPHLFMRGHRTARRLVSGGVLVMLGIAFLLERQGLLPRHDLWLIGPAALVLSAVARLVLVPTSLSLVHAVVRCAIAAYLVIVIEHLGGWTFRDTWPVLLIAVGVAHIGRGLFARGARGEPNW